MDYPYISPQGTFINDTLTDAVWYVMRAKSNIGARAVPQAIKNITSFNEYLQRQSPLTPTSPQDFISVYAPRYRKQISVGVFRELYIFSNIIFVHATPQTLKMFMEKYPYQIFFIPDHSCNADTNKDEYGRPTHDSYMRVPTSSLATLFLSLQEYADDIRLFTAQELQNLKYTRQVLIVEGPLKGRVCRIKSIEGKNRVIVELLEGTLSLVILMPSTHFQRIKA